MDPMNNSLFWAHILFIFAAISTGLYLPITTVLILIILHRIHVLIFNECLFSRLQKCLGGIPQNQNFLQYTSEKLFNKKITISQSKYLDLSIAFTPLILATFRAI